MFFRGAKVIKRRGKMEEASLIRGGGGARQLSAVWKLGLGLGMEKSIRGRTGEIQIKSII